MSNDQRAIDTAMQSMQNALRSIAQYGDCMHDESGTDSPPKGCQCPVCIARKALSADEKIDWRFDGHMAYRRLTNRREADIIDAWKAYLQRKAGTGSPDATFSSLIGDDVSVRDWYVAASLIQWLATNCGMSVLEAAGFKYDFDRKRGT